MGRFGFSDEGSEDCCSNKLLSTSMMTKRVGIFVVACLACVSVVLLLHETVAIGDVMLAKREMGTETEQQFNATNKLVLSTMPRPMTGEHENRIEHIRFHLHCVAAAMKKAKSDIHLVLFTSDEGVAKCVKSTALPMEIATIPLLKEREFSWNLKRLAKLHPLQICSGSVGNSTKINLSLT